jgi:hypothetical protein
MATRIDVYTVGALSNLRHAWRYLTFPAARFPAAHKPPVTWRWRIDRAHSEVYATYRSIRRHIRNRQWHELRQHFNGYLAEPDPWPAGLTCCGRGLTRRAAVRSLHRRGYRQPCDGPYYCPTSDTTECCPAHSGWSVCCGRPDKHRPVEARP